ncbi:MAG: tRNA pseudouridine(38-40) synthase TruA [Firmicutes bacterium]|nr:tRNA pseudouridine(38-40) synthase TruA [Bacillota bacterium]
MLNYLLVLAYDGTAYHGFQFQKNALTIQELLEKNLSNIYRKKIKVVAAGRTDSGVHARGQVANFFAPPLPHLTPQQLIRALNRLLPKDLAILRAGIVPADFHARRDARAKIYTYTIDNGPAVDPFCRHYAWHIPFPLDIEAMRTGARLFVGTHDFKAFQSAGGTVKTTVRTLFSLKVEQKNKLIILTFKGEGFLYKMVRSITGTLMEVGRNRRKPQEMRGILAGRERRKAGMTAPAKGLCLEKVLYDKILPEPVGLNREPVLNGFIPDET